MGRKPQDAFEQGVLDGMEKEAGFFKDLIAKFRPSVKPVSGGALVQARQGGGASEETLQYLKRVRAKAVELRDLNRRNLARKSLRDKLQGR